MRASHDVNEHIDERHEVAEYALLGLLRNGPCHGYRLAAAFAQDGWLRPILRLKMSQMYAYLHKLERLGWLHAQEETVEEGATRPRRIFTLTPEGERAFDDWLAHPVSATRDVRLAFLVKLGFAIQHGQCAALELVARQRAATAAWQERLSAQDADNTVNNVIEPINLRHLALDHRVRQTKTTLAWLDDLQATLKR